MSLIFAMEAIIIVHIQSKTIYIVLDGKLVDACMGQSANISLFIPMQKLED